jgi:hypothetical protein
MFWTPVVLQLAIPLLLIVWVARDRSADRLSWFALVILAGVYLAGIAIAGLWLVVPRPALYGLTVLYAVAVAAGARRPRVVKCPSGTRSTVAAVARLMLAALMLVVTVLLLQGRRAPTQAVDLEFPLRGGRYVVVNGGSLELINAHLMTLAARFAPYRGQSYGVDIVAVNRAGVRARGVRPGDPSRYEIFGDSVFAPCAGVVVASVGGLEDLDPPARDRVHMEGNHVILECGDIWVVLAHLQCGTVRVQPGAEVIVGSYLGAVGNTGNTDEPHLHIHAQRPGTERAALGGDPLSMRFAGKFLTRNQRVTTP